MFLDVQALEKSFGAEKVLQGVSLSVPRGETLSVLGRSGCGKTTLLKIIAGLEVEDAGAISLDGRLLGGVPPQKRGAVYLYQEPLLFPHLDVYENVAFGLRLRHMETAEIDRRVREMAEQLELADQLRKKPTQLSGGQRQRVAFGRALVIDPALLLLDEPFGNLDVDIRAAMQALFTRLAHARGTTAVFVTHDLKEALIVGDRIAFMRAGRLRTYPSKHAFIADPDVGVQREIAFWNGIDDGAEADAR